MSFRFLRSRDSLEQGFTMVELAVALAIIGLFLGVILRMNELIYIAQVRRTVSDVNAVTAAVKGFQDKYGGVPGDFGLAYQQIQGCEPGNANFCVSGDSDSMIGCVAPNCSFTNSGWNRDQTGSTAPQVETTMFWKHLALSRFIKGVNPSANPDAPQWGETHPAAPMNGGFQVFTDTRTAGSSISIRGQTQLRSGPTPGGTLFSVRDPANDGRFMTGKQARYIDEKYDDGKPGAGYFWAIPPGGANEPFVCRQETEPGDTYNPALLDVPNSCAFHMIIH